MASTSLPRGAGSDVSALRAVYLGLAVWGAAWAGLNILSDRAWGMAGQAYVVSGDLLVAEIALFVWVMAEVYVRKNWTALVALPATWAFGLACGLPLYLFLRTAPPR